MKYLKGKAPAFIVMLGVVVIFIVIFAVSSQLTAELHVYGAPSGMINGEYSIDGGPWIKTDLSKPINDHFGKIVFRGKPEGIGLYFNEMTISFKNVWFTLRTADGELIYANDYRIEGTEAWKIMSDYISEEGGLMIEGLMQMAMNMPYTPGYEVVELNADNFADYLDKKLILEVENPYNSFASFSNCVSFTSSSGNGLYLRASAETLVPCLLLVLVCFFGLFLFPVINFVFGKNDLRYLTFGMLCFFWGVYMLVRVQSWYLNVAIVDPVYCMMLDKITGYFFSAALLVYFRSNLKQRSSRIISGALTLGYLFVIITAVVLHLMNICDFIIFSPVNHIVVAVNIIILAVLLSREAIWIR